MASSELLHAIQVAARAHDGRTDRQGEPYIAHAIRVMLAVEGDDARAVAILHDVLEWGSLSGVELVQEHFSPPVLDAVIAMTQHEGEPLEAFLARVRSSDLAVQVKRADLRDNAQEWRLDAMPDAATRARMLAQYRRSAELLGTTLDDLCGRRVA